MNYDPKQYVAFAATEAYAVATRLGVDIAAIADWDDELLREPRVCVPIDVQALVVPGADEATAGVRLDGPLSPGHDVADAASEQAKRAALTGVEPFADPTPRERGTHLHWAMPEALMKGRATEGAPTARGLGLAPLPDKWVVTRILLPAQGTVAVTTSWVVDALTGSTGALGAAADGPGGPTRVLAATELDGTAGGTLTWTAGYDAARRRFTFHDPQDDLVADPTLGGTLPGGVHGGRASYLVVGWWSVPELDPLDDIRGTNARGRRLEQLGWHLVHAPAAKPSSSTASTISQGATVEGVALPVRTSYVAGTGVAGILSGHGVSNATYVAPYVPPRPEASTLLHGAVLGVPALVDGVDERVRAGETRPSAEGVSVALGASLHDALGALTARSLGVTNDAAQRELFEELMTAFTQNQLNELDDPTGAAELDTAVHAAGFETVRSPAPGIEDRLLDGKVPARDKGRRIGKASGAVTGFGDMVTEISPTMTFAYTKAMVIGTGDIAQTALSAASGKGSSSTYDYGQKIELATSLVDKTAYTSAAAAAAADQKPARTAAEAPKARTEQRPDPTYYAASDPYVLVRGAGRSHRHDQDGLWLTDGKLKVRTPQVIADGYANLLPGTDVLAPLPSGAIPPETTILAREALAVSDFATGWLANAAAARASGGGSVTAQTLKAYTHRFEAEAMLRYSTDGSYTGESTAVSPRSIVDDGRLQKEVSSGMRAWSALSGAEPSPVGITAWAQPWCPLWLEFRVEVVGSTSLEGWDLGATDLVTGDPGSTVLATAVNRVPLTTGAATALGVSISKYLEDEAKRDGKQIGFIDDDLAGALGRLRNIASSADLLGASIDGVRRRLLGLEERTFRASDSAGVAQREAPVSDAVLLAGGRLRVTGLRIVDTFGRTLDVDPAAAFAPARLEAGAGELLRPPRVTPPARVRVRLIGAEATGVAGAVDAVVDEVDPARQVSPVCGFLLPDHVDESIEVLGPDATPLGELLVTGVVGTSGGGVVWEPAPGRPVPADAAPSVGLLPDEHVLGRFATGIVLADAAARGSERRVSGESALSALLRSIDTTLWTVDATAGAGSSQVGSIVGSPLAVVRALVSIDVLDDSASLSLDAEAAAARTAAYEGLMQAGIPVRLGDVTRPDDGLVAWFVDDDYSHVHLVDKSIREAAAPAGPGRGLLQEWGVEGDISVPSPIVNPYVSAESEIIVHPGVPRIVTLLMLPGAAVHVTSGIVPRARIQLQRAWFATALDALVPSVRVGPVLVDPGDVRLPLVAALGEHQTLTVREGPTAWRNDAILAATQSAQLPDRATVLREGWVRVTPGEGADSR